MRKIGLICVTVVAGLSLAGCSHSASQKNNKQPTESSSAKKHHTHDENQDDDFSLNLVSSDDQDTLILLTKALFQVLNASFFLKK